MRESLKPLTESDRQLSETAALATLQLWLASLPVAGPATSGSSRRHFSEPRLQALQASLTAIPAMFPRTFVVFVGPLGCTGHVIAASESTRLCSQNEEAERLDFFAEFQLLTAHVVGSGGYR